MYNWSTFFLFFFFILMMILHVSFPMEKLCSSPHECGCSQGRLLLFCCIHAEAQKQKFASVNPVQKPFFVTVNSTNILYCCLYHFCTKNKRGKKKKREESKCFQCVFSATAILVSKLSDRFADLLCIKAELAH